MEMLELSWSCPTKQLQNCCSLLKIPGRVGIPGLDLGIKGNFLLFSNPFGCEISHGILDALGTPQIQGNPSSCETGWGQNSEFWGGIVEDAAALGRAAFPTFPPGKRGIWDPWDQGSAAQLRLIPTFDPNPNIPCSFPSSSASNPMGF